MRNTKFKQIAEKKKKLQSIKGNIKELKILYQQLNQIGELIHQLRVDKKEIVVSPAGSKL